MEKSLEKTCTCGGGKAIVAKRGAGFVATSLVFKFDANWFMSSSYNSILKTIKQLCQAIPWSKMGHIFLLRWL